MKNAVKKYICLLCAFLMIASMACFFVSATPTELQDGKYLATFDTSMNKMGLKAFENGEKKAIIEKTGSKYYLTLSLNSEKISDLTLHLADKKAGETVKYDANIERHTYSLSETDIFGTLNFSMYIKKMGNTQSFTIKCLSEGLERLGDADNTFERPAEFVPVINVNAANTEKEVGSDYIIAPAVAKIGETELNVTVSAYFLSGDTKKGIDITSGMLHLDKVGEYHIVYRAETDKYKTSLGNNSFSEINITLKAVSDARNIVRVENIGTADVLPDNIAVISGFVAKDRDIYKSAAEKMRRISEHYELVTVALYDGGNEFIPDGKFEMFFDVDDKFDLDNVAVYSICEDGTVKKEDLVVDGNLLKITADRAGVFIVCTPGVAFVMPMWVYPLIIISLIVVLGTIVFIVVRHKKSKIS